MLHALRREAHKLNYQETYAIHIGLAEVSDDLKQAMSTMLCKKCLNLADIIRLYEVSNFWAESFEFENLMTFND